MLCLVSASANPASSVENPYIKQTTTAQDAKHACASTAEPKCSRKSTQPISNAPNAARNSNKTSLGTLAAFSTSAF
jgi:hypothetical protein